MITASEKKFIKRRIEYGKVIKLPSTIIEENWSILDIVTKCRFIGWENIFNQNLENFIHISKILNDIEYIPHKKNIFRIFELVKPKDIKVLIIGQDPYHTVVNNEPIANGISFSVNKNSRIPPSLRNIYKEMEDDPKLNFSKPNHGDLSGWVKQGVFLLNSALTVEEGKPEKHVVLWLPFIEDVLKYLKNLDIIYILLGAKAQYIRKYIKSDSVILETTHPSPFSAPRGFSGSRIFSRCNEELQKKNLRTIEWDQLQ